MEDASLAVVALRFSYPPLNYMHVTGELLSILQAIHIMIGGKVMYVAAQ